MRLCFFTSLSALALTLVRHTHTHTHTHNHTTRHTCRTVMHCDSSAASAEFHCLDSLKNFYMCFAHTHTHTHTHTPVSQKLTKCSSPDLIWAVNLCSPRGSRPRVILSPASHLHFSTGRT